MEEYQACLDTLAVIRERDPDYPDREAIQAPARERIYRQQRLRELYNQSLDQLGQEQWEDAIAILEVLQREASGYEDTEARLAMSRHMARMSSLLHEARDFMEQDAFASCVDKVYELQGIDADYRRDEATQLRQQALNRLHDRAKYLIQEKRFEESLVALTELQERSPDYQGVEELKIQAREGIRVRESRSKLDGLYQEAVEHLNKRAYSEGYGLWQEINLQEDGVDYPDPRDVETRARDGLCMSLYTQALGALLQQDPHQTLDLWQQIHRLDPDYPDSQQLEEQVQAMMMWQRKKVQRWIIRLGEAVVLLLLGFFAGWVIGSSYHP
jgi:hypothetical protein